MARIDKRKIIIWGAGYFGGKQLVALGRDNVECFIDSNKCKVGTFYCGKRIVHPEEINDWENYFVYIPKNYYEETSRFLSGKGLLETRDYAPFWNRFDITRAVFEENYEKAVKELEVKSESMKNRTLYWGWDFIQKTNYKPFFKKMYGDSFWEKMGVVSEGFWNLPGEEETENEVPTISAPYIFERDFYIVDPPILDENAQKVIYDNSFFRAAAIKIQELGDNKISFGEASYTVYMMIRYIEKVIQELEPEVIIMLSSRSAKGDVVRGLIHDKKIPLLFSHAGFLYGTFIFDEDGDSSEGVTNIDSDAFMKLPITEKNLYDAREVISTIRENGLSRKIQPVNEIDSFLRNKLKRDRPTVLFAAQIDSEFKPYTDFIKNTYSPIFESSIDAGKRISQICYQNDWNFIYKPHPFSINNEVEKDLAPNSIYLAQGNINTLIDVADVVVTIQSSTDYVALIRNKPVVLLGYDQMKRKGITYEVDKYEDIENGMINAIKYGFTDKQKANFERFIAICLKYYLYNSQDGKCKFGKEPPKTPEGFFELKKRFKDNNSNL
ncbi:Capsule polysaccharide biosynthesis protein [Lachnospiraceae bacterium]|nr:Capsule polysaccharide biosynthesis protein [Lachnospiraceae bacterium]